jgi:hypothetical protein
VTATTRVTSEWTRENAVSAALCPHCRRRVRVWWYVKPGRTCQVQACSRRCANRYLDTLEVTG